jgi:hypothetical protein
VAIPPAEDAAADADDEAAGPVAIPPAEDAAADPDDEAAGPVAIPPAEDAAAEEGEPGAGVREREAADLPSQPAGDDVRDPR